MKKCNRCSKPATLHITEVREGAKQEELHLCESCAQEYLTHSESTEQPESSSISNKVAEVAGEGQLEEMDQLTCPSCGISFREFRSQGRLGCPHDYLAFSKELMPLLENIHGEQQHTGKVPKRAPDGSQQQYRLIKLRSQLRAAIDDEQYEKAAQLRDEIQKLETELKLSQETE
jgi:protein arginine kinase activator